MKFANAKCKHIAIENPVGVMSSNWRKPNQYIEPYYFGDAEKKKTGLWLEGIPNLESTNVVRPWIVCLYRLKKEAELEVRRFKVLPVLWPNNGATLLKKN